MVIGANSMIVDGGSLDGGWWAHVSAGERAVRSSAHRRPVAPSVHRPVALAQRVDRRCGQGPTVAGHGSPLLVASVLAARQDGVLTRAQVEACDVSGALLRMLVGCGRWERLFRGTYLLEVERTPEERRRSWARAAVLAVPGSAVSHHSAAVLLGVQGVPRTGQVHLTRPWSTADRRGLRVHEAPLPTADVVDVDGIPVTHPVRTASDLVPLLPPREALVVLDSARYRGVLGAGDLAEAQHRASGRRGYRQSQVAWALADPGAESPLESRARWDCLQVGLRPMTLQLRIHDDVGELVARSDLAFDPNEPPVRGDAAVRAMGTRAGRTSGLLLPVLCEADGEEPHGKAPVLAHDRHRQNGLIGLRYPVVRVMWADTCVPGRVAASVRTMLASR